MCSTTITFGSMHPRLNQVSAGGFELEAEAKKPEPVMERAVENRKWLWVGELMVEFGCVRVRPRVVIIYEGKGPVEDAKEAIEHWKIEVFEYNVKSKLKAKMK